MLISSPHELETKPWLRDMHAWTWTHARNAWEENWKCERLGSFRFSPAPKKPLRWTPNFASMHPLQSDRLCVCNWAVHAPATEEIGWANKTKGRWLFVRPVACNKMYLIYVNSSRRCKGCPKWIDHERWEGSCKNLYGSLWESSSSHQKDHPPLPPNPIASKIVRFLNPSMPKCFFSTHALSNIHHQQFFHLGLGTCFLEKRSGFPDVSLSRYLLKVQKTHGVAQLRFPKRQGLMVFFFVAGLKSVTA